MAPSGAEYKSRGAEYILSSLPARAPRICRPHHVRSPAPHRYASLYFVTCVDPDDNELMTLEIIHHFVEVLDRYFGNVCELDIIFSFHKVRLVHAR